MGTVKYSGPVASFHCPTEATIRSLKVHFSPKQEGTGDPSPENVRPIVGWDGVVVHNDTDGIVIPEEYQKVEYLQSDSAYAMYINTGVSIASDVEMEMQISVLNVIGGKYLLGRYINNNDGDFYLYTSAGNNTYFQTAYGCTYNNTSKVCDTSKHTFRFNITNNMTYVYCDGTDVLHKTILNTITERPILVAGTSMGAARLSCNTYWVRISKGGVLIRNLIPCRRKSDDKPGMYDTVSQTFYTNAGTGEFLYGPEVSGYTTDYEFGVLGKNKFDYASTTFIQGIRGNDGKFVSDSVSHYTEQFIPVIPATEYTLSGNNLYSGGYVVRVYYSDADKNWISKTNGDRTNALTFITPSNCYYIQIQTNSNNTNPETWQLELGSSATTYEPYDPNKTVYGGWVDLISGEVVREWVLNTHTIAATDGTPGGTGTGGDTNYRFVAWNLASAHLPDSNRTKQAVCDIVPYSNQTGGSRFWLGGGTVYMILPNDNNEYSATIAYAERDLNTTTYHLPPYSIALQTFLAQNNIWSNADYVEVEYDLHETQNILARKQFIIANQPHIEKLAAAPLQNFVTDMAAPLKECKVYFTPVQEGTGDPSSENVRAISGWTGVEVYRVGQRLIPIDDITNPEANYNVTGNSILVYDSNEGGITMQGTTGATYPQHWYRVIGENSPTTTTSRLFVAKDNITVTLSFDYKHYGHDTVGNTWPIRIGGASTTNIRADDAIPWTHFEQTYSLSEGQFISMLIYRGVYWRNLQLVTGTESVEDEPYQSQALPLDWTTEAGTIYGGYVDLVTGEVWETHHKQVIDESSTIGIFPWGGVKTDSTTGTEYVTALFRRTANIPRAYNRLGNLCDKLPYSTNQNKLNIAYVYDGDTYGPALSLPTSLIGTTQETLVQYLTGNPFTFVYALREPILITTLDQTILKALRGTNNIWSNAGDIILSYWKH